jgi:thymidylate synthase ThyX
MKFINQGFKAAAKVGDCITVEVVTDRSVARELSEHQAVFVEKESDIAFIVPDWSDEQEETYEVWKSAMHQSHEAYGELIGFCNIPEESAKAVLPDSTAINLVIKASVSEWQAMLLFVTSHNKRPQVRGLMSVIQNELNSFMPDLFPPVPLKWDDAEVEYLEGPHD